MRNPKSASFFIISLFSLLAGCGPSLEEAQKLGFANADEMEELTARGYSTKNEYVDAVFRSPAFCEVGVSRVNFISPESAKQSDYINISLDMSDRLDWRTQHCGDNNGVKVVWVVRKKHGDFYGIALPQDSEVKEKLGTFNYLEAESNGLDFLLKVEDGDITFFKPKGEELEETWFDATPQYFLIDGLVSRSKSDYVLRNVSIVRELKEGEIVPTLKQLETIGSAKQKTAATKGFQSFERLLHAQSLGFATQTELDGAISSAFKKGFDSVEDQRRAQTRGYADGWEYYRQLEKENDEWNARQDLKGAKINCDTARQSGPLNKMREDICRSIDLMLDE